MATIVFDNARIFDGHLAECAEGASLLVEGGLIREIADRPIRVGGEARRIDAAGRTLMPGLIDLHTHAYASHVDVARIEAAGEAYRASHAHRMLGHALDCGFTTLRDVGGGDWSLWRAIEEGLVRAPRWFYAGKALSMTGGHGDMRHASEEGCDCCACGEVNSFCVIADGVDECLKAVREELRRGAHCIKIMGSGGVASPTDPIWMNQYREDEIRAIVGECAERRTYVTAHCHPTSAIRRCVDFGVRVIEHGTLIDEETARFVAERGAYVVPTMATIFALKELGAMLGFPAASQAKMEIAHAAALKGLEIMKKAGVKLGYGTDLLGETYVQECREFELRREVFSPLEILRQATSNSAEILMQEGDLGCIAPGAHADLILVEGDPLSDIGLLAANGEKLALVMRAGEIVKDRLTA